MRNMKRWLAVLMSSTMVLSGGGIASLGSTATAFAADADVYEWTYADETEDNHIIPDQSYTGEAIDLSGVKELDSLVVYRNGDETDPVVLKRGTDYEVTTDSIHTEVPGVAKIKGIGNYAHEKFDDLHYTIVDPELASVYEVEIGDIVYDGDALNAEEAAEVTSVVRNGYRKLDEDEYTVSVKAADKNAMAGNAGEEWDVTVEVNADHYTKTERKTIQKLDLSKANLVVGLAEGKELTYNGKAQEPEKDDFTDVFVDADKDGVKDENEHVVSKADYEFTGKYSDNTNAWIDDETVKENKAEEDVTHWGTKVAYDYDKAPKAELAVTNADGNYTGTGNARFEIQPFELKDAYVTTNLADKDSVEYDGKWHEVGSPSAVYFKEEAKATEIPKADYVERPRYGKYTGKYQKVLRPSNNGNVIGERRAKGDNEWALEITPVSLKNATITPIEGKTVPVGTDFSDVAYDSDAENNLLNYFTITTSKGYTLNAKHDYYNLKVSYKTDHKDEGLAQSTITINGRWELGDSVELTYRTGAKEFEKVYTADTKFTYDGKAKAPTATELGDLRVKDSEDPEDIISPDDYVVTNYKDNTNAGTATATIEGRGEYVGETATVEFEIQKQVVEGDTAYVSGLTAGGNYYEGMKVSKGKVSVGGKTYDAELTIRSMEPDSEDPDKSYVTEVTAELTGNYRTEKPITVSVDRIEARTLNLTKAVVTSDGMKAGMDDSWYKTSENILSNIKVTVDGVEIPSEVLSASVTKAPDTIKKGSEIAFRIDAQDGIQGLFNFKEATVSVVEASLKDDVNVGELETRTYNGEEQEQDQVVLTDKRTEKQLVRGTDYTITYKDNKNAGTATAIFTGKGIYKDTVEKTFKINKYMLSDEDFYGENRKFEISQPTLADRTYDPKKIKDLSSKFSIKPIEDKTKMEISDAEYSVAMEDWYSEISPVEYEYENQAGNDIYFEVTFDSKNYTWANYYPLNCDYTIAPKTVSAGVKLNQTEFIFDGTDKDEEILKTLNTVTYDGVELVNEEDYDAEVVGRTDRITSENNPTYVRLTFKGNYSGIATADINIVPGTFAIDKVKLTVGTKVELIYDGDPKAVGFGGIYSNDSITGFNEGDYYDIVYKDATGNVLKKKPTDVGTYTATVVATKKYGSEEGMSVEYEITKRPLTDTEFTSATKDALVLEDVYFQGKDTEDAEISNYDYYYDEESGRDYRYSNGFDVADFYSGDCDKMTDIFGVVSSDKEWDGVAEQGNATVELLDNSNYRHTGETTATGKFTWQKGTVYVDYFTIEDQTYTGKPIEPSVVAKDGYDVSADWVNIKYYEDNVNASNKTAKAYVEIDPKKIPADAKYDFAGEPDYITFNIIADDSVDAKKEADQAAANTVTEKINNLPANPTAEQVKEAREAYEKLTDDQKKMVSEDTLNALTAAEKKIEDSQAAVDQKAADAVIEQLNKVDQKTSAADAQKAVDAYNALTPAQKKLVDENAGAKAGLSIAQTTVDKSAADAVIAQLSKVNAKTSAADAKKAVAAYNALTPAQKKLVDANAAAKKGLTTAKKTVSASKKKLKAAKIKKVKLAKAKFSKKVLKKKKQATKIKVTKTGNGKLTFKKTSKAKKFKKIVISKTGKVTLKKGLKKGTYKVKVKVSMAKTKTYKATSKTVTLKIKVK